MGARTALTLVLMLAGSALALPATQAVEQKPLPTPAPGQKIAGLGGFHARSTIVFDNAPERPHVLDATYVFPDRVRLWFGVDARVATTLRMQYRCGSSTFEVSESSAKSRELEGAERDASLRAMDLRRAWMMWPDAASWSTSGLERTADLGTHGRLRARFASANHARPSELAVLGPDGVVELEFKAITWHQVGSRTWPASAEVWHGGTIAWREQLQLDTIDTQGVFLDTYFVPADRRPEAIPPTSSPDAIQLRDLPEYCAKRFEFAAGIAWDDARKEESRLRREVAAELKSRGLALEGRVTIEMAADGSPRACLIRLASVPQDVPPGFAVTPARPGVAQLVTSLDQVTQARLESVRAAAPAGSRTAPAYVRFPVGDGPPAQVLIVVPLDAKN